MITHRPSILHRPVKQQSQANVETSETQYQQEQDYWKARAEQHNQTQDRLMRSLYPTTADKAQEYQQYQETHQIQVAAKALQRQQEEQRTSWAQETTPRYAQQAESYPNSNQYQHDASYAPSTTVNAQEPWKNVTTIYMTPEQEEAQRRRAALAAASENKALMALKAARQQAAQQAEHSDVRQSAHNEESWWNKGSTDPRWIAPEYRPRRSAVPPEQQRPSTAPWGTPGEPQGPVRRSQAAPLPEREYPWSWKT